MWSSLTIDTQTGELYVATGVPGTCATTEPYATAMIELHAANLQFVSSWQVPLPQQVIDSDFGATPTLFTATIKGVSRALVGVAHKNGRYYAFVRGALSKGPVWTATIAKGGSCPNCGDGSISSSAWDGARLYVAGGSTSINGTQCRGSLRALNPATGAFLWQHCLNGPVLGAVTAVSGVIVVTGGSAVTVINAGSGTSLFNFKDTSKGAVFFSAASISNGVLYVGSFVGNFYAFGL